MLLAAMPWRAGAQQLVVSDKPDAVAVTVYRAPGGGAAGAIDADDPEGYALITETRTITLPAGRAVVRFEGVAGNIFPETALVAGLPAGVREKNLDADLLSPRSLYDRALGRRVLLRRTDKATGRVTEQQAVIRSSADGAAVLTTGAGVETLRCAGLNETIVYPDLPASLSARPTLSIETESAAPATVTITLSYLAGGFDWRADYVVQLSPDGQRADLFAWVTLASSDVTSFAGAATQVVAGEPNREDNASFGDYQAGALPLRCWPEREDRYSVSDLPAPPPPPPPPPPPAMMMRAEAQDVVVTGARVRKAVQEELGDLKLYRIADPVTVASQSQKQVGLLAKANVPVAILYRSAVFPHQDYASAPVLTLRARNRREAGLGEPLPAGQVIVFEGSPARPVLAGEASIGDKAVGEKVDIELGERPNVTNMLDCRERGTRVLACTLTVRNANRWPVRYEARVDGRGWRLVQPGAKLGREDGLPLWAVEVPANGEATLRFGLAAPPR